MSKIEKLVSLAESQIGVKESPSGSNKVKYNTWYYGKAVSGPQYPWCCAFIAWLFNQTGMSDLFYGGKKTASCTVLRDYYRAKGQIVKSGKYQAGDLAFFNFSGGTACVHIGLIIRDLGNEVITIEGNTGAGNDANGGQVQRRTRAKSKIVSVARPAYDGTVLNATQNTSTAYIPSPATIKSVQKYLNGIYNAGLTVDGEWGKKSKAALVKALQIELNRTTKSALVTDGEWGPKTKTVFYDFKNGSKGEIVALIQCILCVKSAILELDGVFGAKTVNAVKEFQRASGITADGIVGRTTMELLLK